MIIDDYPNYITFVIVGFIFKHPPNYPNYKELEEIGRQVGISNLAKTVQNFLTSYYNMDADEIRARLLGIKMPRERVEQTIRLLKK